MDKIVSAIYSEICNGNSVVVASIVTEKGSSPRGAGAKMIVKRDGDIVGTIGGGAVEFRAINAALEIFDTHKSYEKEFILTKNEIEDIGMVCGGQVTVYFQFVDTEDEKNKISIEKIYEIMQTEKPSWLITEIEKNSSGRMYCAYFDKGKIVSDYDISDENMFGSKPKLIVDSGRRIYIEPLVPRGIVYVFGGGHISQALVPLLSQLGFASIVYDDMERFSNKNLFSETKKCIVAPFEDVDKNIDITKDDYCVIMTRGHENDYKCLVQCLKTDAYYIGVIGSRKKIAVTQKRLSDSGFSEDDISRMIAPIGLDIKAETPIEIAVSIGAQLIERRSEKP